MMLGAVKKRSGTSSSAGNNPDEADCSSEGSTRGLEVTSRRRAREVVLQILYQCDAVSDWRSEQIDLFFAHFLPHYVAAEEIPTPERPKLGRLVLVPRGLSAEREHLQFARSLASGVLANLLFIDAQIQAAATNWTIDRMAQVDRNVLRLATYEIGFFDDIPVSVSINEAIEITRRFSAPESRSFINGVLDHVATTFMAHPEILAEAQGASGSVPQVANG